MICQKQQLDDDQSDDRLQCDFVVSDISMGKGLFFFMQNVTPFLFEFMNFVGNHNVVWEKMNFVGNGSIWKKNDLACSVS